MRLQFFSVNMGPCSQPHDPALGVIAPAAEAVAADGDLRRHDCKASGPCSPSPPRQKRHHRLSGRPRHRRVAAQFVRFDTDEITRHSLLTLISPFGDCSRRPALPGSVRKQRCPVSPVCACSSVCAATLRRRWASGDRVRNGVPGFRAGSPGGHIRGGACRRRLDRPARFR